MADLREDLTFWISPLLAAALQPSGQPAAPLLQSCECRISDAIAACQEDLLHLQKLQLELEGYCPAKALHKCAKTDHPNHPHRLKPSCYRRKLSIRRITEQCKVDLAAIRQLRATLPTDVGTPTGF